MRKIPKTSLLLLDFCYSKSYTIDVAKRGHKPNTRRGRRWRP
nr:MAG TPA: hypothetical protein [Siphoviridae sp. ctjRi1]